MLDGVIDQYLATVTEREFDAPLLALLQANGFTDVHQLHGAFEFGKDFIAKRREDGELRQYALQSKAGDINLAEWRTIRYQVDEIRSDGLAHPHFDRNLPRAAVLVTTGRLVGGAALQAQDYNTRVQGLGEPGFELWDRDTLRPMLAATPACGLAAGSPGDLLELLGQIDQQKINYQAVEQYTRRWTTRPLQQVAIESAVVANRLRDNRRTDLAATVALAALRAAVCQPTAPQSAELAGSAKLLHAAYATRLLDRYGDAASNPMDLLKEIAPGFIHLTYPVICLRLAEIWGLLGISPDVDAATAARARQTVRTLLTHQPGAAHPVSDNWAASMIPAVLSLRVEDPATVETYLRAATGWVADAYDTGLGLAPVGASPTEEATHFLGPELEHIEIATPSTSYAATVLLDLAAAANLPETYLFILNELLAAGAKPTLTLADETRAQWGVARDGLALIPVVRYTESWTGSIGQADHHLADDTPGIAAWDAIALSTLPRNRHPWWALQRLMTQGGAARHQSS
ncbi:restriction endonuclease [Micromonospora sp. NPDC092111]|uniref:restriction endonuclease n=1 Tax=Micromonospora sp. NPDC092111 TaxID=3364289 RepID=UPI0037F8C6B6